MNHRPTHAPGLLDRLATIRGRIEAACARAGRDPATVTLVAASKTVPAAGVVEAIRAGIRHFGENRVQEGASKAAEVAEATARLGLEPPDWHFIGHLQGNKVRAAIDAFGILHGVDSDRLIHAISDAARGPVTIMLEVNTTAEPTKYGFEPSAVPAAVALARSLPNVELIGLMTMARRPEAPEDARPAFRTLRTLARQTDLPSLSMGMSEDFEVAIEEGATHIRLGRALFGERP